MFYFKNLYQPCVCSCVTMKNIEQCIMHATPWSFGYRNSPRTFAHFFPIAIQSFPGSDCWYCGRHCCLFCLGFCFYFSREKDKSTSVNGVWVRTFTHTNTLTHLIWWALFSEQALCVYGLCTVFIHGLAFGSMHMCTCEVYVCLYLPLYSISRICALIVFVYTTHICERYNRISMYAYTSMSLTFPLFIQIALLIHSIRMDIARMA